MRITLLTAALTTLLMVSCKKDENKESTVDTVTETTSPSATNDSQHGGANFNRSGSGYVRHKFG
jgi:hypothetical protein